MQSWICCARKSEWPSRWAIWTSRSTSTGQSSTMSWGACLAAGSKQLPVTAMGVRVKKASADSRRELEQRGERGRVCAQPQQPPLQREQQHRLSSRSWGKSEAVLLMGALTAHPQKDVHSSVMHVHDRKIKQVARASSAKVRKFAATALRGFRNGKNLQQSVRQNLRF